jgi:hypothetical protein
VYTSFLPLISSAFLCLHKCADWLLHCCWSSPAERYLVPNPAGLWEPSEISDEFAVWCRLYL